MGRPKRHSGGHSMLGMYLGDISDFSLAEITKLGEK